MNIHMPWPHHIGSFAAVIVLAGFLVSTRPVHAQDSSHRETPSVNCVDGRFENAEPTRRISASGLWAAVKYYLGSDAARKPDGPLPSVPVNRDAFALDSGLSAVWLGHATVLLRLDGVTILTDPVFDSTTKMLIGETTRFQPPAIRRDGVPPVDVILISHDHFDHLERSSMEHFGETGVTFIVPLKAGDYLRDWGVADAQIVELDWWDSTSVGGVTFICTPARHLSGRGFSSQNQALWASWSVLGVTGRVFYSGDTGYSREFAKIGELYGPFDLTLMQIGAYGDDWPDIHLTPAQAVTAHIELQGKTLLPVHWGTFDLALHPWDEPVELLVRAADSQDIAVATPRLGEIVDGAATLASTYWWRELSNKKSD